MKTASLFFYLILVSLPSQRAGAETWTADFKVKDLKVQADQNVQKDSGSTSLLDCKTKKCTGYVLNRLLLPLTAADATKYALVFKGVPYNALGNILALLASQAPSMGLQDALDRSTCSGATLHLLSVEANSLTSQPKAQAQAWIGENKTCCKAPTNAALCCAQAAAGCFNGKGEFAKSKTSPMNMLLSGSISSGKLKVGPALLKIKLSLSSFAPLELWLKHATIQGDITAGKITDGVLSGAIPQQQLNNVVIPGVAVMLNGVYTNPSTDAATKKMIKDLFDTNSDGKITTAEVASNPLIKTFLGGDVDVDKDGIKELSLGIGFTAVAAKIKEPGAVKQPDGGVPPDSSVSVDGGKVDVASVLDASNLPDGGAKADSTKDAPAAVDQGGGAGNTDEGCDCNMSAAPAGGFDILLLAALGLLFLRRPRKRPC